MYPLLSALNDGGRLEKLFAGGKRSQNSKGTGDRVKQPMPLFLETSTVALLSPAGFLLILPRSLCYTSPTAPLLSFCHPFLHPPVSPFHICTIAFPRYPAPPPCSPPPRSHSVILLFLPPFPPVSLFTDLLLRPSCPLSQKCQSRQAGNEICFSLHSNPFGFSSPASSSFYLLHDRASALLK